MDSTSSNPHSEQIGTGSSRQTRGNSNASNEGAGSKSQGARSKNLEAFATDLSGSKIDASTKITAAKGSNVTIGDGGAAVAGVSTTFADTIKGIVENSVSAAGMASAANSDAQKHSIDAIVGLAETAATSGASSNGKLVVEVLIWGGLFAAVALVAYFFSKRH